MKLKVNRYEMQVIPESRIDEAYIEEVLGLTEDRQAIKAKRINAAGLSCIACIQIDKETIIAKDIKEEE